MITTLAHIWRYPIKGIGAEPLDRVELTRGRPLPLDRVWAVLEKGGDETPGWRSCRNFLRGAKGPSLMAVTAKLTNGTLTLSHPDLSDLDLDAEQPDANSLFSWLKPIYPDNRNAPESIVAAPPEGMADAPFASVSVLNLASLKAVSQHAGKDMDLRRFRGNFWLDGLDAWQEFDLIGTEFSVGDATLKIAEPISRCRSTEANPVTGLRDTPTLQILEQVSGHTNFGVNAIVTKGGQVSTGNTVKFA